jgi:hypothetical protein
VVGFWHWGHLYPLSCVDGGDDDNLFGDVCFGMWDLCGFIYIYTVRLLMLLFRTLELPKFGKRTPSPAQIGKMIPAYFAKSIDLPKTLP